VCVHVCVCMETTGEESVRVHIHLLSENVCMYNMYI
jgi:hypothetical protein